MKENAIQRESEIQPSHIKSEENIEKELLLLKFQTKKNFKFTEMDSVSNSKSFSNYQINYFNNNSNKSGNFKKFNFNKNKNQEKNCNKNNLNMKNNHSENQKKFPLVYSFTKEITNNNFQDTFISKNSNSKVSANYSTYFSILNRPDKNNTNLNITSRSNSFDENNNNSQTNLYNISKSIKTNNMNQITFTNTKYNAANNNNISKSQKQINFYKNNNNNNNPNYSSSGYLHSNFIKENVNHNAYNKNENFDKISKITKTLLNDPQLQSIKIHDYIEEKEDQKENGNNEKSNDIFGIDGNNNYKNYDNTASNFESKHHINYKTRKNFLTNVNTFNKQNPYINYATNITNYNKNNNSNLFNQSISMNEINENTNFSTRTNLNINLNNNNSTLDFGSGYGLNTNNNNNKNFQKKSYFKELSNSNINIGKESINQEEYEKMQNSNKINSNKKIFSDNLPKFVKQKSPISQEVLNFAIPANTHINLYNTKSNSSGIFVNKLKDAKNTYFEKTSSNKTKGTNKNYTINLEKVSNKKEIISNFSNLNFDEIKKKNFDKENENFKASQLLNNNNNYNKKIRISNFSTIDDLYKEVCRFNKNVINHENRTIDNINTKVTSLDEKNLKSKDVKKNFSNFDLKIISTIQKNEDKILQKKNILDKIISIKNNKNNEGNVTCYLNNIVKTKSKNKTGMFNAKASSSTFEKRTIFTKKENSEIIYPAKINSIENNEYKNEFNFKLKNEKSQIAEEFFGNEILKKQLIKKNLDKKYQNKFFNKSLNKTVNEEEKQKLEKYFLGKEEPKQKLSKTSYDSFLFSPSDPKNILERKETKRNKSLDDSMQITEFNDDNLSAQKRTEKQISANEILIKKRRLNLKGFSEKNRIENFAQPVKRMKRPYFNYTHYIGLRNAQINKSNAKVAFKEEKDNQSNISHENGLNYSTDYLNNFKEAAEKVKIVKKNFSSNDSLFNNNKNINNLKSKISNSKNQNYHTNINNHYSNLKKQTSSTAINLPKNPKVSKSVTFIEPSAPSLNSNINPIKISLNPSKRKSHLVIRRRRTSSQIDYSLNLLNKSENNFEKSTEIEMLEKSRSKKKKTFIDTVNLVKRRTQTADLIKKNVSSICNSQMNINNQILKPLISKDFKNKELKLFKKFFKSSDEDVMMKMNDYFYKSLLLDNSENEEFELSIKSLELEKRENLLTKLDNPKDYFEKLNNNNINVINNINKKNLDIIEENEKEEKLQENLLNKIKSKKPYKESSSSNIKEKTQSKKNTEKISKIKSEDKNNKKISKEPKSNCEPNLNLHNIGDFKSLKKQSNAEFNIQSPNRSDKQIFNLQDNAVSNKDYKQKLDNTEEPFIKKNLYSIFIAEKNKESNFNTCNFENKNNKNSNSSLHNNEAGNRKVFGTSIANLQMSSSNYYNNNKDENVYKNTENDGLVEFCHESIRRKEIILNGSESRQVDRKNNSTKGLNYSNSQRPLELKGLKNLNIYNNNNNNFQNNSQLKNKLLNKNTTTFSTNNNKYNNYNKLNREINQNLINNIHNFIYSPENTKIKNKDKKKFHSLQKLHSLNFDKLSNLNFIRNFNMSFEGERKLKKDLLLSDFKANLKTENGGAEELLYLNIHLNPLINKSFDFKLMNNSMEATAGQSLSLSNLNKNSNLINNKNKNRNSQMQNFAISNFYEKEILDSSYDSSSVISINLRSRKRSIIKTNSIKNNNNYINKKQKKEKEEKKNFEILNNNANELKEIQRKLKSLSPAVMREKPLKKIQLGNQNEFKSEILGNIADFVKYKRDNEILKYDYMTRIDNGLFYKENLKKSIINKLIPGNYINAETESIKIEILHPKFIKKKFSKAMPSFVPGKPIIKSSDQSAKDYCLYYERQNIPKIVKDKDAFSVMTIFK